MRQLILFITAIFILGCAPKTEYQIVYKTKTIYLKPSDAILDYKIDTPAPPDKENYIKATPVRREMMLTNYIIDLLKTIKQYKNKENNLREWFKNDNNGTGN